jgi:hypothetical protein
LADLKLEVSCPNCKAEGHGIWRAEGLDRARWKLLGTSSGFHGEESRTVTGKPVLVCNACDEIQPE